MKRLTTLALALCLTFGLAAQASAISVQPSGVMDFVFVYSSGALGSDGFQKDIEFDRFTARQRSRIQVDFIASEQLRGVMMLQFGTWEWGNGGAALDTTSEGAKVRRLYIDFNSPENAVNIKMGLMDLVLPYATFGQPVFGNHVAAVTVTGNLSDNASLTAFWARPYRNSEVVKDNDMDVFGLWANLDFESFSLAPWAAYASIGTNSGWYERVYGGYVEDYNGTGNPLGFQMDSDRADWWGVGLALKIMPTDALAIKFDAMYASLKTDGNTTLFDGAGSAATADSFDARGYYFALAIDYAADWGTPGLFAIYSSGDDAETGSDTFRSRRIPGLAFDDNIWPTRMAFAGSMTCANDTYISAAGIGLWMVGLQIADLSFMENVSHTARVAYIRGTNHIESVGLAGTGGNNYGAAIPLAYEDEAWEFGFDTYWQMYENLTVGLELGYIYLDAADKGDRGVTYDREGVFSGNLIFRFGF